MTDPHGYMVCLLEDRASLWPAIQALLPERCIGAADVAASSAGAPVIGAPVTAASEHHIGLICWSSARREETASLAEIRVRHPGPLVAVLAEVPNARGARTVAARLEGAVLASELQRALLPTLQAVAVGQCVVPRSIRQIVDRPPLSPRERQILAMIVLDFSNAEIARKLFVTESNVKNHLSSAFQKLGVSSRSAAAELILDGESGLGPGILRISPEESLPSDGSVG